MPSSELPRRRPPVPAPQAGRRPRPPLSPTARPRSRGAGASGRPQAASEAHLLQPASAGRRQLPASAAVPRRHRPARRHAADRPAPGPPIGRVLTKMGKVTREQVVEALSFQKSKGGALGRILIDLGYIKEPDLNIALAAQRGYEIGQPRGREHRPKRSRPCPRRSPRPTRSCRSTFDKATQEADRRDGQPRELPRAGRSASLMGYKVKAKIGDPEQIDKLIGKHYKAAAESIGDILERAERTTTR